MTSVEAESKRPRLGSYEHAAITTATTSSSADIPPSSTASSQSTSHRPSISQPQQHQQYHQHPHHHQYHHNHQHANHPHPSPSSYTLSHHYAGAVAPPSQQQPPPPPPPPHPHPPPLSPSVTADPRARPYSSHASTLPMPTQHGADSSEPSQYHVSHAYHARQYSSEPLSARTPTTPAQQGSHPPPQPVSSSTDSNVKHAPQYYGDPYRAPGEIIHSPYHGHDQQIQAPATMPPPPQQHERNLPYPSMPHQASEAPGASDYWSYGQVITVQADGQPRRKAVRASQACESCRQKKCKCDEEKPICGNCKQNGTQCHYRDVPPPKQERTMMQVMDQISGLAQQIHDMGNRFNHIGGTFVRKDELRTELDSSIKSILHRELREFRDEVRGAPVHIKRSSDFSQSPANRSHFASPNPPNGFEHGAPLHRSDSRRQFDAQQLREGAAAYSPAGSQLSDHGGSMNVRRTPQHQYNTQKMSAEFDHAIKNFDPLAGQLSIPLEHSTAAHKLLIAWHAIHPFYHGIIDLDDAQNYVMRGETLRGNLRIFGHGEGSDGSRTKFSPVFVKQPSQSESDDFCPSAGTTAATHAMSSDGNWGIGFDGPVLPAVDTDGGLNPDGSLCLDAIVVTRLYNSYLQNIWMIQPFLNKSHLHAMFDRFVKRYGFDTVGQFPTGVTSPSTSIDPNELPGPFKAPKRKRSDAGLEEKLPPSVSRVSSDLASRRPLERSMDNALILLTFALGRMCEHKGPLPAPVSDDQLASTYLAHKSPSDGNTPRSAATPHLDSSVGRYTGKPRNIDRIPGLAYFAYAVGILGEHHGVPDVVHVQASLLAGLYLAQMARVIDSWRWINTACTDCQLLFKDETSFAYFDPERADAIRFAYWTCLQLESDILAELDLPPSGISRLEDRMELPNWSTLGYHQDSPESKAMHYYWAQIHLRKILNRAHSALYNSGKEPLKNPGWTIYSADDLAEQLNAFRNTLPTSFQWHDTEEPARDINNARLRGKYYGARYIIHRPFLHHVLQDEFDPNFAKEIRRLKTREKEGIIGMARTCVDAAKLSTTSFDGLQGRPILTNVFGTAHAQFGNILVLAACRTSGKNSWFISKAELDALMNRTIQFIGQLAPLAPTMQTNLAILKNTWKIINRQAYDEDTEMRSAAVSTSFSSSTH